MSEPWTSPPDYAEDSDTESLSVKCENEECTEYDLEVTAEVTVEYFDEQGTVYYTCPTCKVVTESETTRAPFGIEDYLGI